MLGGEGITRCRVHAEGRIIWYAAVLVLSSGCAHRPLPEVLTHPDPPAAANPAVQTPYASTASITTAADSDLMTELDAELEQLEDEAGVIDYAAADPISGVNRVLYQVHRGLDLLFVRPVALTYTKVLPNPVQKGLRNFITNLTAPLRILCRLLQGNLVEARKTAGSFITNTVLGAGGVFNVAKKLGLEDTQTNFTETLKKWGAKPGAYIVVPGIGPTTARGAVGFLLDSFLDPMFLLTLNKSLPHNEHHALMWAETGFQVTGLLIDRARFDFVYEDVENNSTNRYSKLRGLALQLPSNQ